jgi:hypothetical protein
MTVRTTQTAIEVVVADPSTRVVRATQVALEVVTVARRQGWSVGRIPIG